MKVNYFQRKVVGMIVARLQAHHPELRFVTLDSEYVPKNLMVRTHVATFAEGAKVYLDLADRGDGRWFAVPLVFEDGAMTPIVRRRPYSLGNRRGVSPDVIADRFSDEVDAFIAQVRRRNPL